MAGRPGAAAAFLFSILCLVPVAITAQEPAKSYRPFAEGILQDVQTSLLWTAQDNGQDVTWEEAGKYCKSLELGGFTDWRLPTIEELKTIFDPAAEKEYKTPEGIDMSDCCVWSDTRGTGKTASNLNFIDGQAYTSRLSDSYFLRALCVREP